MSFVELLALFGLLKQYRAGSELPLTRLDAVRALATGAHDLLRAEGTAVDVQWRGSGDRSYQVHIRRPSRTRWSRATNKALFINDPDEFKESWNCLVAAIVDNPDQGSISSVSSAQIDRTLYTTLMSWAVTVDLWKPNNGIPGTFLEMIIGPLVSLLSNVPETGAVTIQLADGLGTESVKVDLTFHQADPKVSLELPTKISTRERISQAYVHHAILSEVFPGEYRAVLCVCSENNAFNRIGEPKTVDSLFLRNTLVPGTVALYQKYISQLDGIFYLDPPAEYLTMSGANGFPYVASVGTLLTTLDRYFGPIPS